MIPLSTVIKGIFCLFISIFILGCSSESKHLCSECKVKEPNQVVKTSVFESSLNFSRYSSGNDSYLLSFNTSFKDNLLDLIDSNNLDLKEYVNVKITNNNLAAVIIFTDTDNEDISFSDIDRLIMYIRLNNGFKTLLFKNEDNVLKVQPEYSFHTNYFSSNDIYDFQTVSSPNKKSHSYSIINKKLINPFDTKFSNLQYFLKKN